MAGALADRYIVVLKDTAGPAASARDEAARLTRAHGGKIRHTYTTALHGYAAEMTAQEARLTAADAAVAYVEQDAVQHSSTTQTDPPSWGLDRIDQRSLPLDHGYTYGTTASNVTVYLVDSGLRTTHTQFQDRASIGVDEVGDGRNGQDCLGHGTHVAGTVGGKDYGVAKGVKLVAVRVTDCNDNASTSAIIAAADWITAHAAKPAVVNMSINSKSSVISSEDAAIKKSIASGITWVVSSGNSGTDACKNSPGDIDTAIVVNNSDSSDTRRSSSNYGPCTDLFAPGTSITSAWNSSDTATNTISGTSMAAPHVTGAAALWLAAHPTATPADVQDALINSATTGKIKSAGTNTPNRLLYTGATTSGSAVFSDDFESDKGWQVDAAGTDTATSGVLERGIAQQTTSTHSNQVKQLTAASGSYALTTGAAAGAAYGDNDLDGGKTTVFSPQITLPAGGPLTLHFTYNVANGDNSGTDDYLRIRVLDGTTPTTVFEKTGSASEVAGQWQTATADLSAFAGKTIRVYLEAADAGNASLFEAQLDDLTITQG
ncbi:S8 family serine peptidase [Streptomyces sp. NPDC006393]|uniref:S8 family serine peptidase n=1 Tax=Streptomyces sp. NPDC006393 TaxID=3156763 RepID=UPI0033ED585A